LYFLGSRLLAFSPGWTKGHSVQSWEYALEQGFTLKEYILNSSEPYIPAFISGSDTSTGYSFFSFTPGLANWGIGSMTSTSSPFNNISNDLLE
jgi:hypothetical protein